MSPDAQQEIDQRMKSLADRIERDAKARQWLLNVLSVGLVFLTLGWTALGIMVIGPAISRQHEDVKQIPTAATEDARTTLVKEKKTGDEDYEKAVRDYWRQRGDVP